MITSVSEFETVPPAFTAWGYDESHNNVARLADSFLPKYDFRLDARDSNSYAPSTWVDQDKSGDFDPKYKRPPAPPPTKKKRERPIPHEDDLLDQAPKKPKTTTWQSGRYTGQNGLVTLKVGSIHGRAVLNVIGASSDNWPHDSQSQADADSSDLNNLWSTSRDTSNTSLSSILSAQHLLRKRPTDSYNPITTDFPEFEHITLGHSSARGCLPCLSLHLPCSLLNEGSSYPCLSCRQDNIECELVLPPTRKTACESCKRRRVVCSYRAEGGNHTKPCVQCTDSVIKCVAGPATGRTRTGPSLDQDVFLRGKMLVKPPKVIASCVQCREGKRWCSFRGRKDREPPCKGCREQQIVCTKEAPRPLSEVPNASSPPRKPSPTGITKTIQTRLAHPVTFNYLPSTSSASDIPCHWCTDPLYGLLGLGALRVEILDAGDGTGYVELAGGHTAHGQLPSRMCSDCTLDRLMIVGCGAHTMATLEGIQGVLEHMRDAWMEYLVPEKVEEAPFEWCSVCPAPSMYGCCKSDGSVLRGQEDAEGGDGGGEKGCGLRLCGNCAAMFVHECEGSLEMVVRKLKEEDTDGLGLRADAEFLLPGGELLRQVCCA